EEHVDMRGLRVWEPKVVVNKRKMLFHPDDVREKIRAGQLINRLQNHALGLLKPELTTSQVRAIEILLRKCVPDLVQTDISAWLEKYSGSSMPVIDLKQIKQ